MMSLGVGTSISLQITSGSRLGSMTQVFSSDLPHAVAFDVLMSNAGLRITVATTTNATFGLLASPLARLGHTQCEASEWASSSALMCKVASGEGLSKQILLTYGVAFGSLSEALSYDALAAVSVAPSNAATDSRRSTSASVVDITFAVPNTNPSMSVRHRETAAERSNWISETSVQAFPASGTSAS
eukprot:3857046-Rhodomonas_salina.1